MRVIIYAYYILLMVNLGVWFSMADWIQMLPINTNVKKSQFEYINSKKKLHNKINT